jgi:hypothetical protein
MQLEIPLWLLREVLDDLRDQGVYYYFLYTFYVHTYTIIHTDSSVQNRNKSKYCTHLKNIKVSNTCMCVPGNIKTTCTYM